MTDEPSKKTDQDQPARLAGAPIEPAASTEITPAGGAELSDTPEPELMPRMTLSEHLEDLRRRLFYAVAGLFGAVAISLLFGKELLRWITGPFHQAMQEVGKGEGALKVLEVTGAFYMYLKISLYAALVLASPWIFYHIWMFVGAGLYKKERRYVKLAVPFSTVLFIAGAWFAVFLSIPAMKFFIKFGDSMGVDPNFTLQHYVEFMTNLVLAFGLVFQMPLVVLVLARVGILNMKRLQHYRRHVIVICAGVAAFLAPPDVFSMVAMLVPMWVLYELGIGLAWFLVLRNQKPQEQDQEPAEA